MWSGSVECPAADDVWPSSGDMSGGVPPCGTGSKTRTGFLKWALVGFFFINHGLVCTFLQSEGFSGQ